jgi:hypothetical protein
VGPAACDIEIIKKELPIDILEFFSLTPLPGSEDPKKLNVAGGDIDPDLKQIRPRAHQHRSSAHVAAPLIAPTSMSKRS